METWNPAAELLSGKTMSYMQGDLLTLVRACLHQQKSWGRDRFGLVAMLVDRG
ncbi:MAG: hypothetical protein JW850_01355 [Thermoflexales bacterium]|nr:hypothetical protein [Thermoflexales bacterium]